MKGFKIEKEDEEGKSLEGAKVIFLADHHDIPQAIIQRLAYVPSSTLGEKPKKNTYIHTKRYGSQEKEFEIVG